MNLRQIYALAFTCCILSCSNDSVTDQPVVPKTPEKKEEVQQPAMKDTTIFSAWTMHYKIGRGLNISTFEAPHENAWSGYWRDNYPEIIKNKGFTSIRLPVRYDNKVGDAPDFKINQEYMDRIDYVVNKILDQGLVCILDFHHIDSLNKNPNQKNQDMFVKVWEQLAVHYKHYQRNLLFELYNEPHGKMTDEILNDIYKRAYEVIRQHNLNRVIVFGGNNYNNTYDLINDVWIPKNDKYVIGTFHRYKPNNFTHQKKGDNVKFTGTAEEIALATDMMKDVADWSEKYNIPVLMGEFGNVKWGGTDSRVKWTKTVVDTAKKYGFSMTYWSFNGGVPEGWFIYDPEKKVWIEEIVEVVLN